MNLLGRTISYIRNTAIIPSFSSYEERLHPYIISLFETIPGALKIEVPGNNLLFRLGGSSKIPPIALTAHLDKINHYGKDYPRQLPVNITTEFIEGAMDDAAGLGILLTLAEVAGTYDFPDLLFFFSEMEESKGLKEHPHLLKNKGEGYESGMGAGRIAEVCIRKRLLPEQVITVDTTPLFKGDPGVALYSRHWEYNKIEPSADLLNATENVVQEFLAIDQQIHLDNNTNDYLHYGKIFNGDSSKPVVSVALEPAIFPYHQKGERVYLNDINRVLQILIQYLGI